MKLRNIILGVSTVAFVGALLLFWFQPGMLGLLILTGLLLAGTALERVGYGQAAASRPPGRNWELTAERFVDPESGRLVAVWFDPATGERRYVDAAAAPAEH
jgi:hypothetical protein